jgi:hypothetical protein
MEADWKWRRTTRIWGKIADKRASYKQKSEIGHQKPCLRTTGLHFGPRKCRIELQNNICRQKPNQTISARPPNGYLQFMRDCLEFFSILSLVSILKIRRIQLLRSHKRNKSKYRWKILKIWMVLCVIYFSGQFLLFL